MTASSVLPAILRPEHEPLADELLRVYFGLGDYRQRYTGAHFDVLGRPWYDPLTLDAITATDIVAVSCLSVDVPADASVAILGPDAPKLSRLLRQIPADVDLWVAGDAEIGPDSASWRLWDTLRAYPGMGPTTTSKLIARKRPRLAPIYDDVVGTELSLSSSAGHWKRVQEAMLVELRRGDVGESLHARLADAAARVGLNPAVTPLRVFDVLVWLAGNPRQRSVVDEAAQRVRDDDWPPPSPD